MVICDIFFSPMPSHLGALSPHSLLFLTLSLGTLSPFSQPPQSSGPDQRLQPNGEGHHFKAAAEVHDHPWQRRQIVPLPPQGQGLEVLVVLHLQKILLVACMLFAYCLIF
jgi:hypothetical protein